MNSEISVLDFANIKKQTLQNVDNSKKGSIDEPIKSLLEKLNSHQDLVSTSSCSGRTIIIAQSTTKIQKKNCHWIYSSHDYIKEEEFLTSVKQASGPFTLKFEPFILHLQCRSLHLGRTLLNLALGSGFRNSGLVLGKHGKITVAVRSTNNLEVPLSDEEGLLVSDKFLMHCIQVLNEKLTKNFQQIKRFEEAVLSCTFESI